MNSIADTTVIIQTSPESVPATPPWLGEVALLVRHLDKQGVLEKVFRVDPKEMWRSAGRDIGGKD